MVSKVNHSSDLFAKVAPPVDGNRGEKLKQQVTQ